MEPKTLEADVAKMLVDTLNLDVNPAVIRPETSLFGDDGLNLDSIDGLEIALAVSHRYGFQMRAEHASRHQAFNNLRSLSRYIQAQSEH